MNEILIDIDTAALRLGIGRSLLYTKVISGEIPSIKIGRCRRLSVQALNRWVESQLADHEGQGAAA